MKEKLNELITKLDEILGDVSIDFHKVDGEIEQIYYFSGWEWDELTKVYYELEKLCEVGND